MALIVVYVPRSSELRRADFEAVLDDVDVEDLQVTSGRTTDAVEITLADTVDPETEGVIRGKVAALVTKANSSEIEQLRARVDELEQTVRELST